MPRNRRRAREAEEAQAAAEAAELRSQARRWWIRALLAIAAGALAAIVTTVMGVLLGLVAVWALVQGFRLALRAQRLEDGVTPAAASRGRRPPAG